MCFLIWKHTCQRETGQYFYLLTIHSTFQMVIIIFFCHDEFYFFFVCVCSQAVPESSPRQCERHTSQRPGKVCQVVTLKDSVKNMFCICVCCILILTSIYSHRFAYKDEYEKFKLYMTIILLFGAITCLFVLNYRWENFFPSIIFVVYSLKSKEHLAILFPVFCFRVTDEIFNFLLVWYYCTLTIRESVLMSNGSRYVGTSIQRHRSLLGLKRKTTRALVHS